MSAPEVVAHEVQCDRVGVVFYLLRKTIRKPSEAAHTHSVQLYQVGQRDTAEQTLQ